MAEEHDSWLVELGIPEENFLYGDDRETTENRITTPSEAITLLASQVVREDEIGAGMSSTTSSTPSAEYNGKQGDRISLTAQENEDLAQLDSESLSKKNLTQRDAK